MATFRTWGLSGAKKQIHQPCHMAAPAQIPLIKKRNCMAIKVKLFLLDSILSV